MTAELDDIEIFGVYDRGIPNAERVVLRINRATNLKNYFLILGTTLASEPQSVWPITDQMLWLTDINMEVPGWVFVYTGIGQPGITMETNTSQPAHNLFWNKNNVILNDINVSPALVMVGKVDIGNKPNKELPLKPPPPAPPPPAPTPLSEAMHRLIEAIQQNNQQRNKFTDVLTKKSDDV